MESKAQIVATIGPASKSIETLREMIQNKMDVARLNFSHGTYDEHREYIKNIREAAEKEGRKIPIIQDLSGPRITTDGGHGFDSSKDSVLTEKDIEDLKFGISEGVEYVAMSFVGSREDIISLKNKIEEFGGKQRIIGKIERKDALDNLDGIVDECFGVMIARGDLGDQLPYSKLPTIQKRVIETANWKNKLVIVATEMMLTMVKANRPSRAEVSDVYNAVLTGADAVMLSEETAVGDHPELVIKCMESVVREAEEERARPPITL